MIDFILKKNNIFRILLVISISFFILGTTLPIFTTTKFFFWKEDVSLVKSIILLFKNGDYFLALIILSFTLIFPIVKYFFLIIVSFELSTKNKDRLILVFRNVSKWSMLDVFVIAMLILTYKLKSGFFVIDIRSGTIFFTLAVITSIICSLFLIKK